MTPPPSLPILRGTTQQALFDVARQGVDCEYRALRIADLLAAQGVWLISSMTLAARVHTLDGRPLPPAPMAAEFAELVDAAIVSDRVKSVVGVGASRVGRAYTGKEVVREIDSLWTCEVAAR